MLFKRTRYAAALGLALAMFLQGAGLVFMDGLKAGQAIQWLAVSLAVAALTHEAWRNRSRLDHRVDMAIVMIAFGGLGMLIGMQADHMLARSHGAGPHAMHGSEVAAPMAADMPGMDHSSQPAPRNRLTWAGFKASLFSWMTGLMLLGGIPPTWFMTRCARLAGRDWRRWVATHLFGNAGMIIGMIVFGKLFGAALSMKLGAMMSGRHLAMLVGMFAGMELFQFAAEAVFGLKPWRRIDVAVDGLPIAEDDEAREATVKT